MKTADTPIVRLVDGPGYARLLLSLDAANPGEWFAELRHGDGSLHTQSFAMWLRDEGGPPLWVSEPEPGAVLVAMIGPDEHRYWPRWTSSRKARLRDVGEIDRPWEVQVKNALVLSAAKADEQGLVAALRDVPANPGDLGRYAFNDFVRRGEYLRQAFGGVILPETLRASPTLYQAIEDCFLRLRRREDALLRRLHHRGLNVYAVRCPQCGRDRLRRCWTRAGRPSEPHLYRVRRAFGVFESGEVDTHELVEVALEAFPQGHLDATLVEDRVVVFDTVYIGQGEWTGENSWEDNDVVGVVPRGLPMLYVQIVPPDGPGGRVPVHWIESQGRTVKFVGPRGELTVMKAHRMVWRGVTGPTHVPMGPTHAVPFDGSDTLCGAGRMLEEVGLMWSCRKEDFPNNVPAPCEACARELYEGHSEPQ